MTLSDRAKDDKGDDDNNSSSGKESEIDDKEDAVDVENARTKMMNDDNITENEEGSDEGVPIDKGWAWMVALGSFFNYLIHCSYFFVMSVLFLDLISLFETTATVVTLIFSINNIAYCISTQLLVNLLMPVISVRTLTTICAVIYSLSTLVIVACPQLPVFFIVSNIKFIAQGGVLIPSLTLVGHYFRRYQALATSITLLGISVASITIPPATRYLRDEFGFRGAFLIMAGYEMNAVVSSLLLRPLSSYQVKKQAKKPGTTDTYTSDHDVSGINLKSRLGSESSKISQHKADAHETEDANNEDTKHTLSDKNTDDTYSFTPFLKTQSATQFSDDMLRTEDEDIQLKSKVEHKEKSGEIRLPPEVCCYVEVANSPDTMNRTSVNSKSFSCLQDFHNTRGTWEDDAEGRLIQDVTDRLKKAHVRPRDERISSLEKLSNWSLPSVPLTGAYVGCHGSTRKLPENANKDTLSADLIEFREILTDTDQEMNSEKASGCCERFKRAFRSTLDTTLLKNYLAILALIAFTMNYASVFVSNYLPSHADRIGVSKPNAALLLTIIGVVDVICRTGFGYFADLGYVRPSRIIACATISMGIVCQFVAFYNSFEALIFMAVAFGVLGLTGLTLNAPLIIDVVGIDSLGKMLALGTVLSGIFNSIQYPIHGAMIEYTGSFVPSFHYIGATYLLGGTLLLFEPLIGRLQKAKERRALAKLHGKSSMGMEGKRL